MSCLVFISGIFSVIKSAVANSVMRFDFNSGEKCYSLIVFHCTTFIQLYKSCLLLNSTVWCLHGSRPLWLNQKILPASKTLHDPITYFWWIHKENVLQGSNYIHKCKKSKSNLVISGSVLNLTINYSTHWKATEHIISAHTVLPNTGQYKSVQHCPDSLGLFNSYWLNIKISFHYCTQQ